MTVSYENSEADATNALVYYNNNLGQIRRQYQILKVFAYFLLAVGLLLGLVAVVQPTFFNILLSVYLFLCGGLILFRQKNMMRSTIAKLVKSGAGEMLIGPHELTLAPEGLGSRSRFGHGVLYWSGIEKVVELEESVALHFSAAQAILVPKRAFSSPSQGAEFLRLVEKYRTEATGTPIPETTKGAWWTQSGVTEAEDVQKAGRS